MQDLPLLILAAVAIAYVWTIAGAAADAQKRGKSPLLVALLVALLPPWPLGVVAWCVFRPKLPRATRIVQLPYSAE